MQREKTRTAKMMSTRVLQGRRVVRYLPNLQAAVSHFRTFSSYDEGEQAFPKGFVKAMARALGENPSLDSNLGPIDPYNDRFPFPGQVGLADLETLKAQTKVQTKGKVLAAFVKRERNLEPSPFSYTQIRTTFEEEEELEDKENVETTVHLDRDQLEYIALECPTLMRRDFQDLFPTINLKQNENLTVITISQRTENDMMGWSEEVEKERELLLEEFVKGAKEICQALKAGGFWADFIDPSSGRPYLGEFTNATMFETDERYRRLGFTIEDMGCCKVISHHVWGTQSYVGCIFTDAPLCHPIIEPMC